MATILEPPISSRSALEAIECPHRYKKIYVEGVEDESPFSRRGSAFHMCVRKYIERLVDLQLTGGDQEEANKAFEEGIREVQLPPSLVPEVRDLFDRYTQNFDFRLDLYLAHEERMLRPDAEVPHQFEADQVYGHVQESILEIVDTKTYFRKLSAALIKSLVQTRYYIWAAMQEWPGWQVYQFTMSFPRLNTHESVQFVPSDFDDLDREIKAMEASRQELHKRNHWPAIAGDQCAFCSLDCPLLKGPVKTVIRVNDPETFAKAAGLKLAHEQQDKLITAALKSYVTVNGRQNVHGEVFDFWDTVSRSYFGPKVVDLAREKGITPDFLVSASGLKKMLKAHPAFASLIDGLESEKKSSRFSHKSEKKAAALQNEDDDE